jgi:hypothetical protein
MLAKLFWYASVFLFGLAVLLANMGGDGTGGAVLDYRFCGLIILGTLSAVLRNILRASATRDPGHGGTHFHHVGH